MESTTPQAVYDPAKVYVTASEWGVSYCSPAGFDTPELLDSTTLNVHQVDHDAPNNLGGYGRVIRHAEWDGRVFPSADAARQFALDHGLIREFAR